MMCSCCLDCRWCESPHPLWTSVAEGLPSPATSDWNLIRASSLSLFMVPVLFPKTMHGNMQLQNLEINNNYICIVFFKIVLLIFSTWFIKMSDFWCFHQFLSQSPASPPVSCCTARVSCSVHGSCSGYMGGWGMLRKSWDRRNGFLVDLPWIYHGFSIVFTMEYLKMKLKTMENPW